MANKFSDLYKNRAKEYKAPNMDEEDHGLVDKVMDFYKDHKEVVHNTAAAGAGVVILPGVIIPAALGVLGYQGGKYVYKRVTKED